MDITVEVNGKPLEFGVELSVYNTYINELQPSNKVAPAANFLMRSVKPDSKDDLRELMELPSAGIQIAAAVIEEYSPDLEIKVGKSKP